MVLWKAVCMMKEENFIGIFENSFSKEFCEKYINVFETYKKSGLTLFIISFKKSFVAFTVSATILVCGFLSCNNLLEVLIATFLGDFS